MKRLFVIAIAIVAASSPALGDDGATAQRVMREALLEHAPAPSHAPALPDRTTPDALAREHLAASKAEAERAAHGRARKDAGAADAMRAEMANRAAMAPMMRGCGATGTADSCAGSMPADMMKSQGKMPGGGMMPGGSTSGGSGMPGSGMPSGGGGMPSGGGGGMSGGGMLQSGVGSDGTGPAGSAGVRR